MDTQAVWAEIDLDAVAGNVEALRKITRPEARLMAVVKANAYGHGYGPVARTALRNGATVLGVARVDEGVQLRQAGFSVPVLIFGHTPPGATKTLLDHDLTQTVSGLRSAEPLSAAAETLGKSIRVHLKVDTGMGRLGLQPEALRRVPGAGSAAEEVEAVVRLPGLDVEGIYTHFATADSANKTYALRQFQIFSEMLEALRTAGIEFPIRHAANSAAIIDLPETHLDMVRAGISLYGLYPSDEVDTSRVFLRPAMTLKTRVAHLKQVPAGFNISYGCTYRTPSPTVIATVPVGYADGLNRLLSSRGHMLVCGRKAPIVGRVCMDQTMLDVGHVPEVDIGAEVVVFGRQGDASITVDEVAEALQTINYEIVSSLTGRVHRRYAGEST